MINPAPSATAHTVETPSQAAILVEQVDLHAETHILDFTTRDGADRNATMEMRKMALRGPPIAREDRLARQTMESRLSLTPEIYNLLAIGEIEDTDPPVRTCHPAFELPPPAPPQ